VSGTILITPRSLTAAGHPALARLQDAGYELVFTTPGQQPTTAELLQVLPGCVGYLAGVEEVDARVLEAARGLRVISRNGVGTNNLDLKAARRLGITVCTTPGANARGVAELAMAHLLALARWVPFSDHGLKAGGWQRRQGMEVHGKTLGLIGCGHVGRLVARFALGMDMKVLAYDVMPDTTFAPSTDFRFVPLADVLSQSDVISLHCPALDDGRALIDAAALATMKQGVFLINTARAELIDAAALAAALQCGKVAGAAVDVFRSEPPTGDPLVACDRVVATPHIGGFTGESVDRAVEMAVDNLLQVLNA
jgi:phosphoglycerate dehydrogenase-like enzyme